MHRSRCARTDQRSHNVLREGRKEHNTQSDQICPLVFIGRKIFLTPFRKTIFLLIIW